MQVRRQAIQGPTAEGEVEVGGVAFRLFDGLPKVGDKVSFEGYEITAREVKGLRISQVQVYKTTDAKRGESEQDGDQHPPAAGVGPPAPDGLTEPSAGQQEAQDGPDR